MGNRPALVEQTVAVQLVIVLAVGTALVALCQRLALSPILGYLATGILVGPSALGWLTEGKVTYQLAELGVVFLMFTIGLEFSLPRLMAAKRMVLGLGTAQVVLTASVFGLAAWWWGNSPTQTFVLSAALAMSSTAIVLKQLGEQLELTAPHGRVTTGILLLQDLAALAVLVVLPILAENPARLSVALALALAKAAVVFVGLAMVGRHLLPQLLHWVAATRSQELFMLTSLLLAMAAAGVAAIAGLSPTLGAFMAGMLLGETLFRHQIEADIQPFRDLMLGLFFVTIGMQLDPKTFTGAPMIVALILAGLVVGKAIILAPLVRVFGQTAANAWRVAISLAQGGEFGLLIISSALLFNLIDKPVAQSVLGSLILSMVLASLLLRFNGRLAALLTAKRSTALALDVEARIAAASSEFERHAIVCGYGRIGQNLVRILREEGVPSLALDLDAERVRQAAAAAENVLFGNAAQPGVLRAAGIERARVLAITIDDAALAARIVSHVRALGAELPVLVRSTQGRDDQTLIDAGAEVFPEGLEASLAFAGQLLIMLDVPPSRVEARLSSIRAQDYAPLRVFFHDTTESGADARDYPEQVRAVVVGEGHYADRRTPQELSLAECGVELIDVRRGAIRVPGHLLDTRLRAGDVLMLKGSREALELATACLTRGI